MYQESQVSQEARDVSRISSQPGGWICIQNLKSARRLEMCPGSQVRQQVGDGQMKGICREVKIEVNLSRPCLTDYDKLKS